MIINSITGNSFAASVWSAVARTLTQGFLGAVLTSARFSISATTNYSPQPGTGSMGFFMFASATPGTALQSWNVFDGTNLDGAETVSATNAVKFGMGANLSTMSYRNGSAGAINLNVMQATFITG